MSRPRTVPAHVPSHSPRAWPNPPAPGAADAAAAETFVATLGDVFRDPDLAVLRFESRAEREGWGSALRELRHNPRYFGRLRGSELLGPIPGGRRDRALSLLPDVVRLGEMYLAHRGPSAAEPARSTRAAEKGAVRSWLRPAAAALATVLVQ